jgi:hypothetical protein
MTATGATTATVEAATHLDGGTWMRSGYGRTGRVWTAQSDNGQTTWTELCHSLRARIGDGRIPVLMATLSAKLS